MSKFRSELGELQIAHSQCEFCYYHKQPSESTCYYYPNGKPSSILKSDQKCRYLLRPVAVRSINISRLRELCGSTIMYQNHSISLADILTSVQTAEAAQMSAPKEDLIQEANRLFSQIKSSDYRHPVLDIRAQRIAGNSQNNISIYVAEECLALYLAVLSLAEQKDDFTHFGGKLDINICIDTKNYLTNKDSLNSESR